MSNIKELIEQNSQLIKQNNHLIEEQILEKLQRVNPFELEKIVTQLLIRMGFAREGKAITTKKTGDGGVDCILQSGEFLISPPLFVQVKRFQAKEMVSRSNMDQFIGALTRLGSHNGLFVTTSYFTKNAKQAAVLQGIALLDGPHLAKLLLKYKQPIVIKQNTLKKPSLTISQKSSRQTEKKH